MNERTETAPIASPEWTTAVRSDRKVTEGVSGGWRVSAAPVARGASFTDFTTHSMAVPSGDDRIARGIRAHELLHARFSPVSVPSALAEQLQIPVQTIRTAEELRLNMIGVTSGVDTYLHRSETPDQTIARHEMSDAISAIADGTEAKAAAFAVDSDDWRGAVLLMVNTWGLETYDAVKRTLRKKEAWKEPLRGLHLYLRRHFPTNRWNWATDSRITSTEPVEFAYMNNRTKETSVLPEGFQWTIETAQQIEQIIQQGGVGKHRIVKPTGETTVKDDDEPGGDRDEERRVSDSQWAGLRLGVTSLTEKTASFLGRRRRPSITGKYPVRLDRLLTDPERRVFRQEVRGLGGVVLFDCSGSMRVDYEVVRNTVAQFEGCTVLAYSYEDKSSVGTLTPNLWVLARNGWMISAEEMAKLRLNRGNGVDGSALRYAVQHKRTPRDFVLWVSDCGVTGVHDDWSDDLLMDCADVVRRNGIMQAHSCDGALEVLAKMKRDGAAPRNYRQTQSLSKYIDRIENGSILPPVVHTNPNA